MRTTLIMLSVLILSGSAYGQSVGQDVMRGYQQAGERELTAKERDEIAAERQQLQLQYERMLTKPRGVYARIAAHRANRAAAKLTQRPMPSITTIRGVAVGGASMTAATLFPRRAR